MKRYLSFVIRLWSFVFCLWAAGCTHNITKDDFESNRTFNTQFNHEAEDKTAEVTFVNNSRMDVESPKIEGDSLKGKVTGYAYLNPDTSLRWERPVSFPVSDIKRASVVYHTGSILKGTLMGAAGGLFMGIVFLKGSGGISNSGEHTDYFVSAVTGAVLCMIPSAILGGFIGEDYIFTFNGSRPDYGELNQAKRFGLKLGYHPGFSPEIIGDGSPGVFNSISANGHSGFIVTMFYNHPLSRMFSNNNELSLIYAGSDETNTIKMPAGGSHAGIYTENPVSRRSLEIMGVVELASLLRLNIKRSEFAPYLIFGPRLDLLMPGSSDKVKFYQSLNTQYSGQAVDISGHYNSLLLGGTFGGGLSTGKLLPAEILIEVRYNFDITSRFILHYDTPLSRKSFSVQGSQDISYFSREWVISVGAALPKL